MINGSECSGHGKCISPNVCECDSTYTGANCSIPFCYNISAQNQDVCSRSGYCVSVDKCECFSNLYIYKTNEKCEIIEFWQWSFIAIWGGNLGCIIIWLMMTTFDIIFYCQYRARVKKNKAKYSKQVKYIKYELKEPLLKDIE